MGSVMTWWLRVELPRRRRRALWRAEEYVRAVCEGERWEAVQVVLVAALAGWAGVAG